MAVRLDARSAILDGELVAVDDAGRADNAELERRIAGKTGRAVAFLAFDLLHIDGRSLLNTPLHRRRELLKKVLHPGDEVVAVPAIAAEGQALHAAAAAQGIGGIMARQRTSPYLAGVKSRLWRFVPVAPAPAAGARAAQATLALEDHAPTAAAPVLALISRLPLLFDE
jgi:bifunctional non-homologous end joining protein LigD